MSKICPNCQEVFDDSHAFCSNCGSRLIENVDMNPALNLGDANAISGGVALTSRRIFLRMIPIIIQQLFKSV